MSNDYVTCGICGKKRQLISLRHLKSNLCISKDGKTYKDFNISSISEYEQLFGASCSDTFRKNISKSILTKWETDTYKNKLLPHISNLAKRNWENDELCEKLKKLLSSKEHIEKLSKAALKRFEDPRQRLLVGKESSSRFLDPAYREKISKIRKYSWATNEEMRKKILHSDNSTLQKMNKLEKFFNDIIPADIEFVSGRFWRSVRNLNGELVHMTPDFRKIHTNKVIELYGNWWHRFDDPKNRINLWKIAGCECIVFWEKEVYNATDNVLIKLERFLAC